MDRTNKLIWVTDAYPLVLCVCTELFLDPRNSFEEPFLFAFLTCKVGAGEDQCNEETVSGIPRELLILRLFLLTQQSKLEHHAGNQDQQSISSVE